MKILYLDLNDYPMPPPTNVIRADTYISIPTAVGMQKKGHDISFLCPPSSTVEVKKIFTSVPSLSMVIPLDTLHKTTSIDFAREMELTFWAQFFLDLKKVLAKEHFDILHIHTNAPIFELVLVSDLEIPVVFTLHQMTVFPKEYNTFSTLFNTKNNYFVSISDYERKAYPSLNFIDTVYNGIYVDMFPFKENSSESLLYAGRIIYQKGGKEAIQTAVKTNKNLIMTGSIEGLQGDYYKNDIAPILSLHPETFHFLNHVDRATMPAFYAQGKALLFPIQWEEPFGLVMTESMACGTPVIAFARGSVPEVIKDEVTGFIVNPSDDDIRGDFIIKKTGIEGMCEAVERLYAMPGEEYKQMRRNCRKHVEEHFTVEKMVDGYEKVYEKILSKK